MITERERILMKWAYDEGFDDAAAESAHDFNGWLNGEFDQPGVTVDQALSVLADQEIERNKKAAD